MFICFRSICAVCTSGDQYFGSALQVLSILDAVFDFARTARNGMSGRHSKRADLAFGWGPGFREANEKFGSRCVDLMDLLDQMLRSLKGVGR